MSMSCCSERQKILMDIRKWTVPQTALHGEYKNALRINLTFRGLQEQLFTVH